MLKLISNFRNKCTNWWLEEEDIGKSIVKIVIVSIMEGFGSGLLYILIIALCVKVYNMFHKEEK